MAEEVVSPSPVASPSVATETETDDEYETEDTAFRRRLRMVSLRPKATTSIANIPQFVEKIKSKLSKSIKDGLAEHAGVKAWIALKVRYAHSEDAEREVEGHLASKADVFYNEFEIEETVNRWREQLENRNLNFVQQRSSLRLARIEVANLHIGRHRILGNRYHPLPKFLSDKTCIVNVQNNDDRCFGYAIASALFPAEDHVDRPSKYAKYFKQLGLHNIHYPVEV